MNNIEVIILAAGKGSRMYSSKPKVLHTIAGKPLLEYVLASAYELSSRVHVVYGFGGKVLQQAINNENINWVEQTEQLGTGHAVMQVMPYIKNSSIVVVLYGDVPFIKKTTLVEVINKIQKNDFVILSAVVADPSGYGRIIRDSKAHIQCIIEDKDASAQQLKITEINTGIIVINSDLLKKCLQKINKKNTQSELYLTDIVDVAVNSGVAIGSVICKNIQEIAGVNDKLQLSKLERILQKEQANNFMLSGLTLLDPKRFDCRGNLSFKKDCEIDINVILSGNVELGNNVVIGANCSIKNAKIGDNVVIMMNCVIEDAVIGNNSQIGPFARIRPQTNIKDNAQIGNFVEVKKSTIGKGSKVAHLSYIGDTIMGSETNIGAGVITCNYDGVNKYKTKIGDHVFIGSNSQLIAPVIIGAGSTVGAGSTIVKDVAPNELALTRSKQISFKHWRRSSNK